MERAVSSESTQGSTLLDVVATRAVASMLLLGVDVILLVLATMGVVGPVRFGLGLVLGLVIPGWSIVGLLRLDNAPLEVGLSIAVSLALLIVTAQLMITYHLWHPIALEELTCLACIPSLFAQAFLSPVDHEGPT